MASKTQDRLDRIEALLERLIGAGVTTSEEITRTVDAIVAPARRASVTKLPASAELNALQGQCRPSAARIVEKHASKGIGDMAEYVGKLSEFQTGSYESPRFQYATAMLQALKVGGKAPAATRVGLKKPPNTDKLTPRKVRQTATLASIAANKPTIKQPHADASNNDWQAYLEAIDPTFGGLGRSGRWHRADAARKAASK